MKIGNLDFNPSSRTYIMGILNVTPDSFSDGGKFSLPESAVDHALSMERAGADFIDVGGESTRPGHSGISSDEEMKRVIQVIRILSGVLKIPISIDTSKAVVAEAAVEAGALFINDVWGCKKDRDIALVAANKGVLCCLMHNRDNTNYKDLIREIKAELLESVDIALSSGVKREKIIIDPGIGFGKTVEQNLEVLARLKEFRELGFPMLLGTSRKSFIGISLDLPVNERLEGTIATNVIGINSGCSLVRVHDVKENFRAARMTDILLRSGKYNG